MTDEEDGDEDEEEEAQRQTERSCKFNPVYDKRSSQIRSTPPSAGNVNRNSGKSVRWSAVPVAPQFVFCSV